MCLWLTFGRTQTAKIWTHQSVKLTNNLNNNVLLWCDISCLIFNLLLFTSPASISTRSVCTLIWRLREVTHILTAHVKFLISFIIYKKENSAACSANSHSVQVQEGKTLSWKQKSGGICCGSKSFVWPLLPLNVLWLRKWLRHDSGMRRTCSAGFIST